MQTSASSPPSATLAASARPPAAKLLALTLATLLVHGYHPFAEDGGLYVAGVQQQLNPALFPHDTAFVAAHTAYSLFAPCVATLVRVLHLSLEVVLLLLYVASIATALCAVWRIASFAFRSCAASWFATALFAAWFTLPVAGTSLLLMDPYVTARTLSTPLSLLAVSFFLPSTRHLRTRLLIAVLCLALAALFHPLMAAYAAAFLLAFFVAGLPQLRARRAAWIALALCAVSIAALWQHAHLPESHATRLADISRYYWFLSRWQWFEWVGLAAPLLLLALLPRLRRCGLTPAAAQLSQTAVGIGLISTVIAACFAQEHHAVHAVARLQPLRAFLLIYAVMIVIVGGSAATLIARSRRPAIYLWLTPPALAIIMFFVQRQTYPASLHLQTPARAPVNQWALAFLWAKTHTPVSAYFAIDSAYITIPGEDAQTFRAIAQRSVLADRSKDGGEAAITPAVAETWLQQSSAQSGLDTLDDFARDARLRPYPLDWLVLRSTTRTSHPCPYDNGTVKICQASAHPAQPKP